MPGRAAFFAFVIWTLTTETETATALAWFCHGSCCSPWVGFVTQRRQSCRSFGFHSPGRRGSSKARPRYGQACNEIHAAQTPKCGRRRASVSRTRRPQVREIQRKLGRAMIRKARIALLWWSVWRMAAGIRNTPRRPDRQMWTRSGGRRLCPRPRRGRQHRRRAGHHRQVRLMRSRCSSTSVTRKDAARRMVQRADPALALSWHLPGYGAADRSRAAPEARVYPSNFAEANASNARRIWAHAGAMTGWCAWSAPSATVACTLDVR